MPSQPFQPAVWSYEPSSVARARAASAVQSVADQVSPLVAKGDSLSLTVAQQIAQQARQDPAQKLISQNQLAQQIGQHVQDSLSGNGGALGGLADTFRAAVPQGVRDVAGRGLRAATSAQYALNLLPVDNNQLGSDITGALGNLPGPLGPVAKTAFDVGLSPLSIATAGTGALGASALGDTFLSRIAAQTVAGLTGKAGSTVASGLAEKAGAPPLVQTAAGLAGGLAGGAAGIGGVLGLRALTQGAEGAATGAEAAQGAESAGAPSGTSLSEQIGQDVSAKLGAPASVEAPGSTVLPEAPAAGTAGPAGVPFTEYGPEQEAALRAQGIEPPPNVLPSGTSAPTSGSEIQAAGGMTPELQARYADLRAALEANGGRYTPELAAEYQDITGRNIGALLEKQYRPDYVAPTELTAEDVRRGVGNAIQLNASATGQQNTLGVPLRTNIAPDVPLHDLMGALAEAQSQSGTNAELLSQFRSQQFGGLTGAWQPGSGMAGLYKGLASMRGQAERLDFPPLNLAPEAQDAIVNEINATSLLPGQKLNAATAILDMLHGKAPTDSGFAAIAKAFGQDAADELANQVRTTRAAWAGPQTLMGKIAANAGDVATLPRSLVATGDLHNIVMRGAILGPSHPSEWWNAIKAQVQAYVNPETAQAAQAEIESNPNFQYLVDAKVDQLPLTASNVAASAREESFMSNLADKLPWVARSHTAFTIFGNKLRADVFYHVIDGWTPEQLADQNNLEQLGTFLNAATGRGDLPQLLERHADTLNALFFAPRRLTGLIQSNTMLATAPPLVQQEVAKSLAGFYGTGIALLGMAKLGGLDVTLDPRSSNFGKAVLPNGTRLDWWAGLTPLIRTVAQIVTRSAKSGTTGNVYPRSWQDSVTNFLRGKLAPVPSLVTDVMTGTQMGGTEELQTGPGDIATRLAELATPMFLQDIIEGAKAQGLGGAVSSLPAGIGVSSYVPTPNAADAQSQQMFGKPYAQLSMTEKGQVLAADPTLQQQQLQNASTQAGQGGASAQTRLNTLAQQQTSDERLASGQMTPRQWTQQRSDRLTRQRGALQQIYGANKPITDAQAQSDPRARYLQAIDQSIDPATGAIDQVKLAAIRASWSPAINDAVNKAVGDTGTPMEQVYRQAAASYFSTPKYVGYTGQEGDVIDKIHSLVTSYAQQLPGDKTINAQRIFNEMQQSGQLQGVPPNILTGVRRLIMGALPTSPLRGINLMRDPVQAMFFGSQLRPGQLQQFQQIAKQAVASAR